MFVCMCVRACVWEQVYRYYIGMCTCMHVCVGSMLAGIIDMCVDVCMYICMCCKLGLKL